jgi:hypothetical protein
VMRIDSIRTSRVASRLAGVYIMFGVIVGIPRVVRLGDRGSG